MAITFSKNIVLAGQSPSSNHLALLLANGEITNPGAWLILHIACDNNGASGIASTLSVTDTSGNVWTVLAEQNRTLGVANDGTTCFVAYCQVATALEGDGLSVWVDLSFNSLPSRVSAGLDQFYGINSTTPVSATIVGNTGGTTTPLAITRSVSAIGQMVYGSIAIEGPVSDGYTEDTDTLNGSWVSLTSSGSNTGNPNNDQTTRAVYKITTATGTQSWAPTLGTTRDHASELLVFGVAPSTGPSAGRMLSVF